MKHPNKLDQQLDNLRTLKMSYNEIAKAAEAYNTGKVELAAAISAKGVETSPTETYPQMAKKVNAITQETYEINGGEMYAKQLFGALETPDYWNLYEVLAQLLSDGRLVNYGGILLAEYYRGYDSLALSGAGAGGAYVVSDKDANGDFIMYTNDTTHVWDTEFDGKGNRWVAYCFADEYHDFEITDTNTSPRSIFIGRKVGHIINLVNGRTSKIVVPDGNEMRCPICNGFTNNWERNIVLRIKDSFINSNYPLLKSVSANSLYLQIEDIKVTSYQYMSIFDSTCSFDSVIIRANQMISSGQGAVFTFSGVKYICVQANQIALGNGFLLYNSVGGIKELCIITESLSGNVVSNTPYALNFSASIYFGYITNDKTKSVMFSGQSGTYNTTDVQLQDGWCKPLSVSILTALTEANMYAHILQRLKQDEPDCGDGVTITLGSTNLAKLTSAESVQLLDDLTNIYGYTFA